MVNLNYFDRVRYTLYNKNQGSLVIQEPIGWQSDEKEISRHEQYHGIISRFSNSSKFIGSGKDFIQLIYDIEGINAEIELKREEKHPQTDIWTLSYSGYLDLSTWETENNQISVKFNSGGLEQLLKARESEQVEMDRTTTIDGKLISDLQPVTVALDGRKIFLNSKFENPKSENTVTLYNESNAGNTRNQTSSIPFELIKRSHEQVQDSLTASFGDENLGSIGMMFFAVSDRKRTFRIKSSFSFLFNLYSADIGWAEFKISLTRFKNASEFNNPVRTVLFSLDKYDDIVAAHDKTFQINSDTTITLEIGESLSIEAFQKVDFKVGPNAKLRINLSYITGTLIIQEDSVFERSNAKSILAHELLDRLVTIGTNKEKSFYSDFLGRTDIGYGSDGSASLTAITHGFWVRQFDKFPIPSPATSTTSKVENLFKPITTSFKDAVASIDALYCIGVSIETVNFKERVRVEELSYFYNNNTTIRLPFQVKNVKRSVATNYYYSGLEFGSEKGGDYQESMGLDEYNTKSTFTTIINRVKENYSKLSKYRSDAYGMEFARRKSKLIDETQDTVYDNDIFFLDLKKGSSSTFQQRKWQDDLDKEPTGVFNPETATNLRLSPFNCLLRHSWWFGGGFAKYKNDFVRYGSSTANSGLKTKIKGKNEYAENGNIINSELATARFFPEFVEFEHVCDFEIMQMVEGTTTILGKEIKNFYGLVEFINENNDTEKGFLFNLKPNAKGSWKILTSNR